MTDVSDAFTLKDGAVYPFQIENASVRGRYARLGLESMDPILRRHAYPDDVARLVGEAVAVAALIGASLKAKGRLIVQAEGDGPVSMLVGEFAGEGDLRGYARFDAKRIDAARRDLGFGRMPLKSALGEGAFAVSFLPEGGAQPYQSVASLEGETLAAVAEKHFQQSEQIPTRLRISVAEIDRPGEPSQWRAGAALLQQIAPDATRGDTEEDWSRAAILFETLEDDELADPELTPAALLHRLYHEDGVRVFEPLLVRDQCTCSPDRVAAVLQKTPLDERLDMADPDGLLRAKCQFCSREYVLDPSSLEVLS